MTNQRKIEVDRLAKDEMMTASTVILAIAMAAVIAYCIFCALREAIFDREAFNEKWPPITEEEFLAACRPGTDPAIALRVRKIVSEQLGVEYARLHPEMSFVKDLGAD
jgi:hypothetical protein